MLCLPWQAEEAPSFPAPHPAVGEGGVTTDCIDALSSVQASLRKG